MILFLAARQKYITVINQIRRCAKESKLHTLSKLEKKDPTLFWKGVNDLVKTKETNNTNITSNIWSNHFNNLLNSKSQNRDVQFHDHVKTALPTLDSVSPSDRQLDYDINHEKIKRGIKSLKRGKSHGSDTILNGMLKCSSYYLVKPLAHLFSIILKNHQFPESWSLSYIVPIHKKADTYEVHNYRGIAISSCLSKLFTSILNERLMKYMPDNNLWRRNQCGFMKGHRTEDNIFILQTLFHKYPKK